MKKILLTLLFISGIMAFAQFPELAKNPQMKCLCNKKNCSPTTLPVYFKLAKNGSTFTAYKSNDKKEWEVLGDITLNKPFAGSYLFGMAVCAHTSNMLNLSEFNHVKIEPIQKK